MKTLRLSDRSDFLSTRFVGEIVRHEIEEALATDPTVELDFSRVAGISHSFADECFGTLLMERGLPFFRQNIRFTSLNEEARAVIRFVLADRSPSGASA